MRIEGGSNEVLETDFIGVADNSGKSRDQNVHMFIQQRAQFSNEVAQLGEKIQSTIKNR